MTTRASVSVDGDLALIGAIFDDDKGTDSGAAYIDDLSYPNPFNPTTTISYALPRMS